MDLYNLPEGLPISLKVKREGSIAVFDTTVIAHVDTCLVCAPMYQDNKLISFPANGNGVSQEIEIFDKDEGRLFAWRKVEVKVGYYKKTTLAHLIYLRSDPVEINRRNNYRQYIGIEGKGASFRRAATTIHIRDVSNNGIGFVVEQRGNFEVGRTITVSFTDCGGRFNFTLACEIVRERELENGSIEFGCSVISPPQSLATYVAHKQLMERKRVLGLV